MITKGYWYDHLEKLELTLQKLQYNGLKCNIEKSFSGQTEMEYLGLWVTMTGIRIMNKNISHSKHECTKEDQRGACVHRHS